MSSKTVRVGLISDTHGLLRPEAIAALQGCRHIVHAGDIGDAAILEALAQIAPMTAVRGNNDCGQWAGALRPVQSLSVGQARIYVIHDVKDMDVDAAEAGYSVVVCGHSHRPQSKLVNGVLYVNPGSAGPRRFNLPVCVGSLLISGSDVQFTLHELDCGPATATRQPRAGHRSRRNHHEE